MSFSLSTEAFSGPLDLMLHLIREKKLDIFDLDMDILTDQYIAYLSAMEKLHLEIESEYLVELATLIEYKSKKLLPQQEDEAEELEDPRDELVWRLLEYQKFKEASKSLQEAYNQRQTQLSKDASYEAFENPWSDNWKLEGDTHDLYKAMRRLLKRLQLTKPVTATFTYRELSIDDRILTIKAKMIDLPERFLFEDLLEDCQSVQEVVITFLALLDLAKDHILYFSVDQNDVIHLMKARGDTV